MKIICSWCKKLIGEKEPFDDPSPTHAKCPDCIQKQKEQEKKSERIPDPDKEKIVIFKNGVQGILSIGGKETSELSLFELEVNKKSFVCHQDTWEEFKEYVNGIAADQVEVTFLHTIKTPINILPQKGRSRKREVAVLSQTKPPDIQYNCTIKVPKEAVYSMFDDMADRSDKFAELVADATMEKIKRDRQAQRQGAG